MNTLRSMSPTTAWFTKQVCWRTWNVSLKTSIKKLCTPKDASYSAARLHSGAPNGSVPQNICSSGQFLLAGRCGRMALGKKQYVLGRKVLLRKKCVWGDFMFRIVTMCYGSETPPSPRLLRGEFCPMTTPKPASNVWNYVCWETSRTLGSRL